MNKNIVIYDLEYTCWEGCLSNGWSISDGQYREIIQIGAIEIDPRTFEVIDVFESNCRPLINFVLSDFCSELTNIEQKEINNALSSNVVLKNFFNWVGVKKAYAHGDDFFVLQENIKLNNLNFVLSETQWKNISYYFREKGAPININSGRLHKFFGIKMKNKEHNALFDCYSILESLKYCEKQMFETECS